MTLPLCEVQKLRHKASKPGNIYDEYVRVQDINSAVDEAKKELSHEIGSGYIQCTMFKVIDKWLRCKK